MWSGYRQTHIGLLVVVKLKQFNPNKPNEYSHPYTLDESICHLRGIRYIYIYIFFFFHFCSICNLKSCKQTVKTQIRRRIMHNAASDLDLHCLPVPHKRDPRLIWVKKIAEAVRLWISTQKPTIRCQSDGLVFKLYNAEHFHWRTGSALDWGSRVLDWIQQL